MNATLENAYALLAAIDPLPHPAQLRLVAETARSLSGTPALTSVLSDLNGGGVFERCLALTMARITRTDDFLGAALADPDFGIRCRALDAVVGSPRFDDAIIATFEDAPIAWRRAVVRAVRKARRTDLADRIATGRMTTAGPATSQTAAGPLLNEQLRARLLPVCSEQVVGDLLPGLTHLPVDWLRLGKAHPNVVLDVIERGLDELPDGLRSAWWTRCADGVAGAVEAEPERVLRLLERYEVWQKSAFPNALAKRLRVLTEADPVRTLRLLVDAEARSTAPRAGSLLLSNGGWGRAPRMSRSVRRTLLLGAPEDAVRWGLLCRDDDPALALLLKTLPPARRAAYFDAVTAGQDQSRRMLAETVLDVLPRARRHREARRMLTLPGVQAVPTPSTSPPSPRPSPRASAPSPTSPPAVRSPRAPQPKCSPAASSRASRWIRPRSSPPRRTSRPMRGPRPGSWRSPSSGPPVRRAAGPRRGARSSEPCAATRTPTSPSWRCG